MICMCPFMHRCCRWPSVCRARQEWNASLLHLSCTHETCSRCALPLATCIVYRTLQPAICVDTTCLYIHFYCSLFFCVQLFSTGKVRNACLEVFCLGTSLSSRLLNDIIAESRPAGAWWFARVYHPPWLEKVFASFRTVIYNALWLGHF